MSTITVMKDVGAYLKTAEGTKGTVLTTASGTVNGTPVDRTNYLSASLVYDVALAQSKSKTSTVTLKVQHSDSTGSSTFEDYAFADGSTAGVVTIHSTATTTPSVAGKFDVNLMSAKTYIRATLAKTFPTGSTVTLTGPASSVFVFGGVHDLG